MTDIRITDKNIQEWKQRLDEVETEIMRLEYEKKSIQGDLEFVRRRAAEAKKGAGAPTKEVANTKAETILSILKETKRPMAPKDLKAVLRERKASEKTWGPDYVYVHQILNRDKKRNHPMFRTTNTGRYLPASGQAEL